MSHPALHPVPAPFRIAVPDAELADLTRRLRATRFADAPSGVDWSYGSEPAHLRALVASWADAFDWRAVEVRLNALPQFRVTIDGQVVHFVHQRGRGPAPLPLILTHGWPSTFAEMAPLVPLLTDPAAYGGDPADAFDVVVPSLPGFGFSGRPPAVGTTPSTIAALWATLMHDVLGYPRYGAHGGDIGASVTARLAFIDAPRVAGIHLTFVSSSAVVHYLGPGAPALTDAELAFQRASAAWSEQEGAYAHLQRTKPQALADALNDSPAGLLAWLVDKYRRWSDCDGVLERRFTPDDVLTQATIYRVTQTIGSSIRLYRDSARAPWRLTVDERVAVPTGVALFRDGLPHPPREWAERVYHVTRWVEMPRGGHFPAHEEPVLLAAELRTFFRGLR